MISFICIVKVSFKIFFKNIQGLNFPIEINWITVITALISIMVQKLHIRLSLWTSDVDIRKVSLDFNFWAFFLVTKIILSLVTKLSSFVLFFINPIWLKIVYSHQRKNPVYKEKYAKTHIEVPYIDRYVWYINFKVLYVITCTLYIAYWKKNIF